MLVVLPLTTATISQARVTPFEKNGESCDEAKKTEYETDCRPIPVVDVHRRAQRDCADEQVKIGQHFVKRF